MASPNKFSTNLGLPQSPTTTDPKLFYELSYVYNAINSLAVNLDKRTPGGGTGGNVVVALTKTFTVLNTLTLDGVDGSTINIGNGGTLGTAAYTAASSYAVLAANTFTGIQTYGPGGVINEGKGTNVASAGTTSDIWAVTGNTIHITGTVTMTAFPAAPQAGVWRKLIFDGAVLLTNGANFNVQGGANYTTVAGDNVWVYADTTTKFYLWIKSIGSLAIPGTANPIMNGIVAVGTSPLYARQDHVHASDTSCALLAGSSLQAFAVSTLIGSDTTNSTTSVTGAFKTAGGLGVAKNISAGGHIGFGASTISATWAAPTSGNAVMQCGGGTYAIIANSPYIASNLVLNSGVGWNTIATAAGAFFRVLNGSFDWFTGTSVTAGTLSIVTNVMSLTASGNLSIPGSFTATATASSIPPEAWNTPTLLNSWVNYGSSYETAGYYKDAFGIVHLKGVISSGTMSTNAFVLPVGYRPPAYCVFPTYSSGTPGEIQIDSAGGVGLYVGSNTWYSIAGISFRT